jgi:molecular chaperone DnaK
LEKKIKKRAFYLIERNPEKVMSDFKPIVGIDLGTTFSVIAYVNEFGKAEIIPNAENKPITPSVIYFQDENNIIVGELATNHIAANMDNITRFIKTQIGKEGYYEEFYGKKYTPQELSSYILRKLKQDAEQYLHNKYGTDIEIKDAVIGVPACFNAAERRATEQAGIIANLNVLMIIDEPIAIALSFGINELGEEKIVFVFDLGGGTFDATILQIKGNEIKILSSDRDAELGGYDWDRRLLAYVSELFVRDFNEDPQDNPLLFERIVKAKIELSKIPKVKIPISHAEKSNVYEISQEEFEELTIDLLERCEELCTIVLEKAGKAWSDIDNILLAGGATHMPMVRNMLKKISGKEPSAEVNPDQCVAIGCALSAKYLIGKKEELKEEPSAKIEAEIEEIKKKQGWSLPEVELKEVNTHPIGIVLKDEKGNSFVEHLISETTLIPQEIIKRYKYPKKTPVLKVTKGKGTRLEEVSIIGEFVLKNFPKREEGAEIDVIYRHNGSKILEVELRDAKDPSIKISIPIDLTKAGTVPEL